MWKKLLWDTYWFGGKMSNLRINLSYGDLADENLVIDKDNR